MADGDTVLAIVAVTDVVNDAFGDSERPAEREIVPVEETVIDVEIVSLTQLLIVTVIVTEGVAEFSIVRVFSEVKVSVAQAEVDGAVEILDSRVDDAETDADNDIATLSVPDEDEDDDKLRQVVGEETGELVDTSERDCVSVVHGLRDAEDDAVFEEVADMDDDSLGDAETESVKRGGADCVSFCVRDTEYVLDCVKDIVDLGVIDSDCDTDAVFDVSPVFV